VLDLDSKSFFETIDWTLLVRARRRHTDCTGVLLDIACWLKAPVSLPDGTVVTRNPGMTQGTVIRPLRAHVFLHDVFDGWMTRHYPDIPFERDADDISCHGGSEEPARALKDARAQRFAQWRLALHPHKTRTVYGKDAHRRGRVPDQLLDVLGYAVRPHSSSHREGTLFVSFGPAVSDHAAKAMHQRIRRWRLPQRNDLALEDIARWVQPVLTGWVQYYGRVRLSTLRRALRTLDAFLVRWATCKYTRLRGHPTQAWAWLHRV